MLGGIKMNEKEQDFRSKLSIATNKGFDCNINLVQAILETRIPGEWFGSELSKKNNFYGIKAWKTWKGKVCDKHSIEVVDGQIVNPQSTFIVLPDVTAGINVYCWLIEKYHPKSWATRDNYKEYFKNIASWSTSPTYSKDLTELYEELEWKNKLQ